MHIHQDSLAPALPPGLVQARSQQSCRLSGPSPDLLNQSLFPRGPSADAPDRRGSGPVLNLQLFLDSWGLSPPRTLAKQEGASGARVSRSVGCISPPPMPSCPARPSWHSPSGCTCCFCASLGSLSKQSPQAWPPGVGPPCTTSFLSKSWDADSLRWKHPVCRKINRQLKQGCDSEQTTGLRAADKAGLAASAAVPSPLQRWVPRRAAASFLSLPRVPAVSAL